MVGREVSRLLRSCWLGAASRVPLVARGLAQGRTGLRVDPASFHRCAPGALEPAEPEGAVGPGRGRWDHAHVLSSAKAGFLTALPLHQNKNLGPLSWPQWQMPRSAGKTETCLQPSGVGGCVCVCRGCRMLCDLPLPPFRRTSQ